MADAKMDNAVLEDCRIIFRNFAGKEGKYNREGDRSFAVVLTDEQASRLSEAGWNVKLLKPREEDEEPTPYMQVRVRYGGRPPRVMIISGDVKTPMDESDIAMLDWADIVKADLIVRPYQWEVRGDTGVSAYLNSLYVVLNRDELEMKYEDFRVSSSPGGSPERAAWED